MTELIFIFDLGLDVFPLTDPHKGQDAGFPSFLNLITVRGDYIAG